MKLYISNLSYDTTEQHLSDILSEVGTIIDYRRPTDFDTGNPRGFAFVTMDSRESGEQAIETLNGMKLDGREIKATEAEERSRSHPADRPQRVTMDVPKQRAVDDRPIEKDGQRVRYKSI